MVGGRRELNAYVIMRANKKACNDAGLLCNYRGIITVVSPGLEGPGTTTVLGAGLTTVSFS